MKAVFIRTEDGGVFDTRTAVDPNMTPTPQRWLWTRLEDGTDVLLGPTLLQTVVAEVSIRWQSGEQDPLQIGTIPG